MRTAGWSGKPCLGLACGIMESAAKPDASTEGKGRRVGIPPGGKSAVLHLHPTALLTPEPLPPLGPPRSQREQGPQGMGAALTLLSPWQTPGLALVPFAFSSSKGLQTAPPKASLKHKADQFLRVRHCESHNF